MQETLYQTADAGDSLSDSGCRDSSIRQRMQESLFQTADAGGVSIRQRIQETLYFRQRMLNRHRMRKLSYRHQTADSMETLDIQTADAGAEAGVSLSDSGCRRLSIRQRMQEPMRSLSIRQRMQETLLSDSGCRSLSIRQRMQETLYQTADAGVSPSDIGCRRLSIRQRKQELYIRQQISLSDSGCRRLLRQRMQETLSDSGCRSVSLSDSRRFSTRQRIQEPLYQTAEAEDSLSDSSFRQMQESLYQTADAGDSLSDSRECRSLDAGVSLSDSGSDSGCRRLSIRQRMQETLHQTRMQ